MEENKNQTEVIANTMPLSALPVTFVSDIRTIIEQGRKKAYAAAGQAALYTYWNVGRRIVEEEQNGKARAEYGKRIIPVLAEQLKKEYGNGYGRRNLAYYRLLYQTFPDWEILHTRVQNLEWSHVRRVLSVASQQARDWYLDSAAQNMWSVRELDRNISTQYYERRLAAQLPASAGDFPQDTDKDHCSLLCASRQRSTLCCQIHDLHADRGRTAQGNRTSETILLGTT